MNILITGSTGKIGTELALWFGKKNNLILQYNNNEAKISEILNSLRNTNKNNIFIPIKADLSNPKNNFLENINKDFECSVLLNCASTYTENNFFNFSAEDIEKDININALSPLFITKNFAKNKSAKRVINFLDIKALMRDENHFTYSLSKNLFKTITEECAYYLSPITVNSIALGLNETDSVTSPKNLPIQSKVTIEDIILTTEYLINSPHITGEIINLDSGRHLRK